ncbi:MAG TPA: PKD domain-containing protein [Solirubrobacteraceae bacterium]|nr:PKD domain-containing protein [Solirubrobacteraceae bacterium]
MAGISAVLLCMVGFALTLAGGAAATVESHPHVGRLPGFPRIRGAIPVLGSTAAVSAHRRLVQDAFKAARTRAEHHAAEPNGVASAGCGEELFFYYSQDVCYQGGPVLRDPTVHLIFWQGPLTGGGEPAEAKVGLFPPGYEETVERYFADVAHDRGLETNVFAVDPQYGAEEPSGSGKYAPGVYASTFEPAQDVAASLDPFPVLDAKESEECEDFVEGYAEGPCLLDKGIQEEVKTVAEAKGWARNLESVFFVFTPPGVGSCSAEGCAYKQYCAYHGDFGGNGVYPPGNQTIYVNMPFVGKFEGCDAGVHPNNVGEDNGADAAIDDASHEFNEAITDPLGSQCKTGAKQASECEPFSWTDAIGQEIGDKCLPTESTIAGIYGEPLGEVIPGNFVTEYNQLIGGDHYWTQREWSNAATELQGGCVQRMVHTEFPAPTGARATVPVTFDGAPSGSPGDPIEYWDWNFGDHITAGTPEATVAHTYAAPGTYEVTLTAFDVYGNSNTFTQTVEVGPAPPPVPPPAPIVNTVTVKEPTPTLEHLTIAQLAAKLGLPANGRRLSGVGSIALGRGECPPACGVTLRLYANVSSTGHGRRRVKLVQIGSLHLTIAAKGTGALALTLNATGRSLLRRAGRAGTNLKATLTLAVEDQQGAAWQLTRTLTLTDAGGAARRRRR